MPRLPYKSTACYASAAFQQVRRWSPSSCSPSPLHGSPRRRRPRGQVGLCGQSTGGNNQKKNVVVALSGGVDSSVVAATVKESVKACVHMTNWNPHEEAPTFVSTASLASSTLSSTTACSGASDHADALAVAQALHLPLHHVQFQSEYYHYVFEPFLKEIQLGRMPNPDIHCNVKIKFGVLKDHVWDRFGEDSWLATGHYARLWHRHIDPSPPACLLPTLREHAVVRQWMEMRSASGSVDESSNGNSTWLLQAADASKDQSYFLAGCQSQHFQQVLFPLGNSFKKGDGIVSNSQQGTQSRTVRQLALDLDLPTARKKDSTGICAVGGARNGFQALVRDYLPASTSVVRFVDVDTQRVIARVDNDHACLYTVGQGARISGASTKYFVTDVSVDDNVVHVCTGTHHPALYTDSLEFQMQWVCEAMSVLMDLQAEHPSSSLRVTCRIRHLQPLMDARLCRSSDGRYLLYLDQPTRAVTPGQMAVVYVGLICLGGGPILRRGSTYFERREALPDRLYRGGHNDTSPLPTPENVTGRAILHKSFDS